MTSIAINFKNLAIALAAIGLVIGAAFGGGIAYGRNTTSPAQSTTGQTAGNLAQAFANRGAGGSGTGGGGIGRGLDAILGGTPGSVTNISGNTVTLQTAQGTQDVTVSDSTTIDLLQKVPVTALTTGTLVVVSGNQGSSGSIDATSITELPAELQRLISGTAGGFRSPAAGSGSTGGTTGTSGASGASATPGNGGSRRQNGGSSPSAIPTPATTN